MVNKFDVDPLAAKTISNRFDWKSSSSYQNAFGQKEKPAKDIPNLLAPSKPAPILGSLGARLEEEKKFNEMKA